MNQKHLLTVATLTAVVGIPSVGRAETTQVQTDLNPTPTSDVVKVEEFQSPAAKPVSDAVVTKVHAHTLAGRKAATLFVRNIPALTFISQSVTDADTKEGVKAASVNNNDPVHRAGMVAAKINQLMQDNVDASQITVSWKSESDSTPQAQNKSAATAKTAAERYAIKVNGSELVEINEQTLLPDTTNNLGQDALQATNRLRRLMGNASPIREIADLPAPTVVAHHTKRWRRRQARYGRRIRGIIRGIASFYGYDGSGNKTASGERFNPEAMTAAHRTLPFGTRVRVTNTRNGRSVVVRINDRGPFIRGRVIDLSYGAARSIGMIGRGLAPVKVQVLGR
ncbi:MAG: septal ring lytic transglycosylase RlpA family protein [Nostocaceae cyanobacterium]|nr:septal ring lytic transglycosylase RlpA family protein [Nostocaceae cyanobacterium]